VFYLAVLHKDAQNVKAINIEIESPEGQKSIVSKKEIKSLFEGYLGYNPLLAEVAELDLMELEELLVEDGRMEEVDVFLNAKNELCVQIVEKKVVVRVTQKNLSYYLDEKGGKVPTVKNRAIRVPIATGEIGEYSQELIESKSSNNLRDIWTVAKAINKDPFLKALIEQIDINEKGKMTMVPKIGKEKIMLSSGDIEDKLFNLKGFYKEGLPREGWSKYASINLDIRGQIVAERLKNH
jgi:cell division protein FtsQ